MGASDLSDPRVVHESIIDSLTLFYNTLVSLCYIDTSSIVVSRPEGHEDINIEATREAGLSNDAVALLQYLPYLSEDLWGLSLSPDGTQPATYLFEDHFDWARSPTFQDEPETKSTQFVLTRPGEGGTAVIYDTESRRVTPWNPSDGHHVSDGTTQTELGSAYSHVENYTPEDLIVHGWVKNLISLAWLPYTRARSEDSNDEDDGRKIIVEPSVDELKEAVGNEHQTPDYQLQLIQRTLRDVYTAAGWDIEALDLESAVANFDRAEFIEKKGEWLQRTQAVLDRAYRECWPWQEVREELGGDLVTGDTAALLDHAMPEGWQLRHIQL